MKRDSVLECGCPLPLSSDVPKLLGSIKHARKKLPDPSLIQIFHDRIRSIVSAKLFKDFLQMTMHRPCADSQKVSDFLIGMAFAQQAEDFVFAWSQIGQLIRG